MVLRNFYLVAVLLFSFTSEAQKIDTTFTKEWIGIDTLIVKNDLTRTALEKVNALYQKAKQRQLPDQMLKSLIYRYSLEDRIITDDPNHTIHSIKTQIGSSADETQKAILYSLLAKQYWQYYNNHRWSLYARKNTADLTKEDITTWSNDDFISAITGSFLLSLHNSGPLKQKSIESYDAIIIKGNQRYPGTTVFDLLAHEALDYFTSAESYLIKPIYAFTINDANALAPIDIFVTTKFSTNDSTTQQWLALKLFQELLIFHKHDKNSNALLQADLERFEWVYRQAVFADKEALYLKTLQNIIDQYPLVPSALYAWYLLAAKEVERARSYSAFGDTTGRYGYVRAMEIIEKALPLFKESIAGNANMQNLLTEINTKQLRTETERVNVPYKAFRALVSFRNTDTLFARIIRIDSNEMIRNNAGESDYWKKMSRLPVYRSFKQLLPLTHDYQAHATEIRIEGLPVGEYALLSSSGSTFTDTLHKMCIQFFYVSDISFIRNKNDFFVLNRQTGKPLADVKVTILKQSYINRFKKIMDDTVAVKTTSQNGHFKFKEAYGAGNFRYLFTRGTDRLNILENQYSYFENNDLEENNELARAKFEKVNDRVFFFTDRSIYRPGQSIFFKGIAVTRDYKTGFSKIITAKDSGWVYLRDVNRKTIDSVRFALNNYGSFSARFQLPQNILTGNFSIEVNKYNRASTYFSVEQYKRPKFSVHFQKVKGTYRLNDTIAISGIAKAYAGNAIDGAKVSYVITRNSRYMIPWIWRRPLPQTANRQIAHGEMHSDAEGKFTIKFKALADDIVDRAGSPLFDFTIQADVTDLGGETRTATTQVTTGFSSLLLEVRSSALSETDSAKKIEILTTNLSNEKEPAMVHLKIYSLLAPQRLIRKRYWQRPDQFVMNEKEFIKYFPTDEYNEETNFLSWATGRSVLDTMVDTEQKDQFIIPANALAAGYYRIESSATDRYGVEVKQVNYIQLFSQKNNQLPVTAYQFNYTINNKVEPGQTASFLTGTTANNVFVISKTEKLKQKTGSYVFEYRNEGLKTIRFTADENDRGGVNIDEVYVYDNRVYTHQYNVAVPWTNKTLEVRYTSYRDKTEPGKEEKWTVTVQGNKGEKAAAELLTGMYDASLDQFEPHGWSIPNVWETNHSQNAFIGISNFEEEQSMENYIPEKYVPQVFETKDHLAMEGSQLWNSDLIKWRNDSITPLSVTLRQLLQALNEVVVTGYNTPGKMDLSSTMMQKKEVSLMSQNKSAGSLQQKPEPPLQEIGLDQIKPETNTDGTDRVIRKNFNETAFFFPQLYADSTGKYSFSFTMPEALTQWKWMSLAHTRDLSFGSNSTAIITQKKLMVQPNAPRFMREGDNMEFSTKIVNLTDKEITGQVTLELVDAVTNISVDGWFQNVFPSQYFTVEAGRSSAVKFPIQIPFSFNKLLTWRVVAKAGQASDGEENTLPVLTNRALVTESLPLFLQSDTTAHFRFDKLLHTTSETLTHESITVEYTSNPVWYAVQALPYLMEYPYECSEQTFNRLYANVLASYIVNKHPKITRIFEQWRSDTSLLKSSLQKNEELKQLLLQETPWVLQGENEAQQKKNIGLLFDLIKLSGQSDLSLEKLRQAQLPNGSFSWFKGGYEDRYITNYILTGIGKLKRLGALSPELAIRIRTVLVNAINYMDSKVADDYNWLVKNKTDTAKQQISSSHIDYLYMRSFFPDISQQSSQAYDYFYKQGKTYWVKQNSFYKAELGLIYYRNKEEKFVTTTILPALLENVTTDSNQGMYWKSAYTGFWYQSPIEHQSMMIACMSEISKDDNGIPLTWNVDAMKTWLLLNKQTNNWRTTVATADACYALLLNASDWLSTDKQVTIQLGSYTTGSNTEKTETATGYFKKRIAGRLVKPEMGNITITAFAPISKISDSKISQSPSWGSIYWQYFEDLDKVTTAISPLSLTKKIFIEKNTDKGKMLVPVNEGNELRIGDKVTVRMELRSDRDMDYLHLKDMRAASMEPVNVLSGYKWQDGLGYYESTKDASTNFFIAHLSKGTYVFEYPLLITHTGIFSVGIATIQCMYAPEFTSHSEGIKIRVSNSE